MWTKSQEVRRAWQRGEEALRTALNYYEKGKELARDIADEWGFEPENLESAAELYSRGIHTPEVMEQVLALLRERGFFEEAEERYGQEADYLKGFPHLLAGAIQGFVESLELAFEIAAEDEEVTTE